MRINEAHAESDMALARITRCSGARDSMVLKMLLAMKVGMLIAAPAERIVVR